MKKIKLLCCIHDLRGRGAERVLSTLLNRLDRERFQIGLFVYHDIFKMEIPDDIEIMSAHILSYRSSSGLFTKLTMFLRKVVAITKTLNSYKPDVVLSVAGTNEPLIVARYFSRSRPKVILSEHNLLSAAIMETKSRIARFLSKIAISVTYPKAEMIVVPSKSSGDDLSLNYSIPSEKIRTIPNPLDIEKIIRASKESSDVAFPDDGSFRIGFVGSLTREKNIQCLFRALAILKEKKMSVRLFILGEGEEKRGLEKLALELNIEELVIFFGYRENPYAVMANFDVLVVPSFFESFSYVALEAIICGVPVVSSRWQGCEEKFRDMENCLLFPINDHQRLALAVEKLMVDKMLQKTLVDNGMKLALKCETSRIVAEYENVITKTFISAKDESSLST